MALAIQSSPEADFIFNFRHLPPGPDLRKDPRPGTVTSHGSHNAQTSRNDGSVRTPQTIARYHSRQRRNKEQRWAHDEEDGRDLAASNVPLPSYSGAAARGLKRQEAFVSEATCKRRLVRAQREQIHDLSASDAELINLGILYNDEHVRGAGVTLDTIHHDSTPLYVVRQPRRRPRTTRQGQQDRAVPTTTKPAALPLELSFNALGQDAAIAAFLSGSYPNLDENMSTWLMQPDVAEIEAQGQQDDEDEATPRQNDFCFPAAQVTKTARRGGYEPSTLQIIYEAEDPESVEAEMSDAYGAEDDTQIPDEDEFEYDWASVSGASLSSSQVELDFENDEGEEIKGAGKVTLVGEKKIGGGEMGAHRRVDAWVVLAGDS